MGMRGDSSRKKGGAEERRGGGGVTSREAGSGVHVHREAKKQDTDTWMHMHGGRRTIFCQASTIGSLITLR